MVYFHCTLSSLTTRSVPSTMPPFLYMDSSSFTWYTLNQNSRLCETKHVFNRLQSSSNFTMNCGGIQHSTTALSYGSGNYWTFEYGIAVSGHIQSSTTRKVFIQSTNRVRPNKRQFPCFSLVFCYRCLMHKHTQKVCFVLSYPHVSKARLDSTVYTYIQRIHLHSWAWWMVNMCTSCCFHQSRNDLLRFSLFVYSPLTESV